MTLEDLIAEARRRSAAGEGDALVRVEDVAEHLKAICDEFSYRLSWYSRLKRYEAALVEIARDPQYASRCEDIAKAALEWEES